MPTATRPATEPAAEPLADPAAAQAAYPPTQPARGPIARRRGDRPLRRLARPDEILGPACGAIVERGFAQTRVADIAERAGTSTGTVHYDFDSREEVLVAGLRWASEQLLARLQAPEGAIAIERLARLLDGAVTDGLGVETAVGYSGASPARMRAVVVSVASQELRLDPVVLDCAMTLMRDSEHATTEAMR
jgi:AcrR family transcriptional regulator